MEWLVVLMTTVSLTAAKSPSVASSSQGGRQEYCMIEAVDIKCQEREVIVVESAQYGRMRIGRCITPQYSQGCYKDVVPQLDQLCSGRRDCKFSVSDPILITTAPCPKDLTSYLELSYRCQKVTEPSSVECRQRGHTTVTDASGYISGRVPGSDGSKNSRPPLSSTCTYLIKAQPGQRINISLLDFTTASRNVSGHGVGGSSDPKKQRAPKQCHQYAMIVEHGIQHPARTCDHQRETHVLTSHGSTLMVRTLQGGNPTRNVLLKYEAIGCPTFNVPEAAYVKYDDDTAIVHCNYTKESFAVTCQDTVWRGVIGNCSVKAPIHEPGGHDATSGNFLGLPPVGVSLVIIFGVALVIVVYVGVMIVCVLYVKRKRRRRQELQQSREFMHWSTPGPPSEDKVPLSGMKGPDERLPMLVKQFRGNGDYTDICEMQDIKPFTDQTGTYSVGRFTRSGSRGSTTSSRTGTGSSSPRLASNPGCARIQPGSGGKLLRKSGKPLSMDGKIRPNLSGPEALPFYFDVDGESYNVRQEPHTISRQSTNPDLVPGNHGAAPLDSTFFSPHCSNNESDYGCSHRRDCTL